MNTLMGIGIVGTVLSALCCLGVLTPLLVAGLTAVGLTALTRSLDLILFPALGVFVVLTAIGWWQRRRRAAATRAAACYLMGESSAATPRNAGAATDT